VQSKDEKEYLYNSTRKTEKMDESSGVWVAGTYRTLWSKTKSFLLSEFDSGTYLIENVFTYCNCRFI
jgi:hypothetical protein